MRKNWSPISDYSNCRWHENCRQRVFSPFRLLPPTISGQSLSQSLSASLAPSSTSTTSLTAPLSVGRLIFCRPELASTCDSCSASCRLLGSVATEPRCSRAQLSSRHLPTQLGRQGAHPPHQLATCASSHQPKPPMHFPFRALSNPGI